jgi:hypothetical protein
MIVSGPPSKLRFAARRKPTAGADTQVRGGGLRQVARQQGRGEGWPEGRVHEGKRSNLPSPTAEYESLRLGARLPQGGP